jgi:8-oxo-dGTP pyrophosphatase MutT (NUDIX family)
MSANPVFHHRENQCLKLPDGRELWLARSMAVVSTVVARVGKVDHVALLERGAALPDEVGKLCLPGGYLDWDETVFDAARREVFEETGLDVSDWKHATEPWRIHDVPIGRQNVALHFYFVRAADALPPLSADHAEPQEIARQVWLPLEHAAQLELAFGHQHVLRAFRARFPDLDQL